MAQATQRPNEAGLSLIELMLLCVSSVVVIISLLSGVVSLNAQRQLREERILSVVACRNILEDLRRASVADLVAADGRGFTIAGVNGAGMGLTARKGDADGLPGSISVRQERASGADVLYRVTVAVDWSRGAGAGHVHLTALMGRRR
jgi:hypothetical protein